MSTSLTARYDRMVNLSRDSITLISRDYVYEMVNDAYCKAIGRAKEELIGASVASVWGENAFNTLIKRYLDECFQGKKVHYNARFPFGPADRTMHVSLYPHTEDGQVTHALVFSSDVTGIRKLEARLRTFQFKDPTTGLFNRRSLNLLLDKELARAKRSDDDKLRAVMFIGLEDFSRINQVYGHHLGDVLLENTGLRIRQALRTSDLVFRFEGRELAVLLTSISRTTDVAKVADKMVRTIAVPYRYRGADLYVSCVVGVSVFPHDGRERDVLIQNASSAMHQAREEAQPYLLFNREMHQRATRRMQIEMDLRRAFGKGEFVLEYQPLVDKAGVVQGCEALIRWTHPKHGLVAPGEFIPLAEESGMVRSIGKWALYTACRQARQWADQFGIYTAVNLSGLEFDSRDLEEVVKGALANAPDLDPRFLQIEITETAGVRKMRRAVRRMTRLQQMGVATVIDDFGTGYSSLTYLKELPASAVKIDRSFVRNVVGRPKEARFLQSIIHMAKARDKRVIVEGVDTVEQSRLVAEMGCDLLQGYYFSRPLQPQAVQRFLEAGTSLPPAPQAKAATVPTVVPA